MSLHQRLTKLETKLNPLMPPYIIYQAEHGLTDEQKTLISETEAQGQAVKLICIRVVYSRHDLEQLAGNPD